MSNYVVELIISIYVAHAEQITIYGPNEIQLQISNLNLTLVKITIELHKLFYSGHSVFFFTDARQSWAPCHDGKNFGLNTLSNGQKIQVRNWAFLAQLLVQAVKCVYFSHILICIQFVETWTKLKISASQFVKDLYTCLHPPGYVQL